MEQQTLEIEAAEWKATAGNEAKTLIRSLLPRYAGALRPAPTSYRSVVC